ncbi:MAG: tyrosine-type recombinase/integrase [Planctomycetota bacterium]
MHLQEALGQFQVQLRADGRSEHTRKQYQRHVAALIAWLSKSGKPSAVGTVKPATVAEFFASDEARFSARGGAKKATSANAQRTSLRCFFRWAHEAGLASTNAARLLKRARCAPPPPRALREDEQKRLLEVLAAARGDEARRDEMLVRLLLGTGVRIGSALALDVENVDLEHGELDVKKAKGDRPCAVAIPKKVATQLRRYLRGRASGPLFATASGRVSTRHAQRRLAGWLAAAGIAGRSAHALRHSFAMRVYAKTRDLLTTQMAMGHAAITSTCVYAHADRARVRAAVGA